MKVDRNQPFVDYQVEENGVGIASGPVGIPVRLEIAARLLAASISRNGFAQSDQREAIQMNEALRAADKLIDAHNESCERGSERVAQCFESDREG